MVEKSREWIETECVKALQIDAATRGTTKVTIKRLYPEEDGPNWMVTTIFPPLSTLGQRDAYNRLSPLYEMYALPPDV